MGDLLEDELGLAAHPDATGDCRRAARFGAFLNQGSFEFCEDADHLPHSSVRARSVGDVVSIASVSDREGHVPRFHVV